jgi:hypothetical protein
MSRSFVLSKLRRILYFVQNRVEMLETAGNLGRKLRGEIRVRVEGRDPRRALGENLQRRSSFAARRQICLK